MLSGLTGFDLFNTNQTETGSQFVEALGTAPVSSAAIDGQSVSNTSLFLDIDPNQNATFTETVGAPEPATWSTLLTGALALLLAERATARAARDSLKNCRCGLWMYLRWLADARLKPEV